MLVYVVNEIDDAGYSYVIGIYSSQDAAERAVKIKKEEIADKHYADDISFSIEAHGVKDEA